MGWKYCAPSLTTRTIILPDDPAIGEGADYQHYSDTLDESLLCLTGEPVRWTVRPLDGPLLYELCKGTEYQMQDIAQASTDIEWLYKAARYVVCEVRGLGDDWPKTRIVLQEGRKVLSLEVLDGIRYSLPQSGMIAVQVLVTAALALYQDLVALQKK